MTISLKLLDRILDNVTDYFGDEPTTAAQLMQEIKIRIMMEEE